MSPEPETKRALLKHARTGEWVWHRYVTTVPGEIPEKKYNDPTTNRERVLKGGPVWYHVFESEEADAELRAQRYWGCEDSRRDAEAS